MVPLLHLVAGEGVWGRGRRLSPRPRTLVEKSSPVLIVLIVHNERHGCTKRVRRIFPLALLQPKTHPKVGTKKPVRSRSCILYAEVAITEQKFHGFAWFFEGAGIKSPHGYQTELLKIELQGEQYSPRVV
jgi:hypothetical protein